MGSFEKGGTTNGIVTVKSMRASRAAKDDLKKG
jgi:hypothetical protein